MQHNSKDLRVQRTLRNIKETFADLVLEKNYSDISITELTTKAGINRKTFYLHYSSMDDLISEIENEINDELFEIIESSLVSQDMRSCISVFYHYLDETDPVKQKLLSDSNYKFIYDDVTELLLKTDCFQLLFKQTKHPGITRAFCKTITSIYHAWLEEGKSIPIEEVIDYAASLMSNGYNSVIITEKGDA